MTFLLLLLLIFFVIWPLFKGFVAVHRARRQARQFFDQFRQAAGGHSSESQNTAKQSQPKQRKKINPDDGEFVNYEDLPADSTTERTTTVTVEIEQQIVDVEWEDIK